MALKLIDAAESAVNRGEDRKAEIIMQFGESMILQAIPFERINGGTLTFSREERLPNVGFRAINRGYTEDAGETIPVSESTKIFGGDLDVDKSIIRQLGMNARTQRENMKVRAMALEFDRTFIKGDTSTDSKEFDGLQKRVPLSPDSTQLVYPGGPGSTPTAGGDGLRLQALDWARKRTRRPTHWVMNQTMCLLLTEAARQTGVSGFVQHTQDNFGNPVTMYAGLPIIELEEDNEANEILPFQEAAPAGGAAVSTSIYCVNMSMEGLFAIHNMPSDDDMFEVRDLGEIDAKPCYRTRVETELGLAVLDARSVTRIAGITNVAVTS